MQKEPASPKQQHSQVPPVSLSSPVSPRRKVMSRGQSGDSDSVPSCSVASNSTENNHQRTQAQSRQNADKNGNNRGVNRHTHSKAHFDRAIQSQTAMNVGLMATGLAWVQRQKEQRRRQYLQAQAERQMRKIMEAEQANSHHNNSGGLQNNHIFQNYSQESEGSEYTEEDYHRIGEYHLSKSGEGASAQLELPGYTEEEAWVPEVRVEEEPGQKFILNEDQMQQIAVDVLPRTISYCRWKRLYSLERDGDSFDGCLRLIANESKTLLVVKTTRGDIFGGYADSGWHSQEHRSNTFYGSASASLFKVLPDGSIKVFKWTGANRYIQLCDITNKRMAFGGGGKDGAFGLCVEEDFQKGSTGPCATFKNEPLCDQESFDILGLEFWGFLTGQF
jgi:hypothetical protein